MLLTIMFFSFFAICLIFLLFAIKNESRNEALWFVLTILFGIVFFIEIFCLAVGPTNTRADIKEFEAAKQTIIVQRNISTNAFERVQLTTLIVEKNAWLANAQFWATNKWLNWFYDKSILKVEPIK